MVVKHFFCIFWGAVLFVHLFVPSLVALEAVPSTTEGFIWGATFVALCWGIFGD